MMASHSLGKATVYCTCYILYWASVCAGRSAQIRAVGINYGRLGDNLPAPNQTVNLILNLKAGYVKIYDADATILKSFADTGLPLVVSLQNDEVPDIGGSQSKADEWVQMNILPYVPSTQVSMIMVGNEIFSHPELTGSTWSLVVQAMRNIYSSLQNLGNLSDVRVTTSVAMDALNVSYPPSAGRFREELLPVFQSLLSFLSQTNSYFFLDVYPYLAWESNSKTISLDYALLSPTATGFQDGNFRYDNMLDAQIDAVVAAMETLGYPDVQLALSETGWPSLGDKEEAGASIANASLYNTRLVSKITSARGTPRRPNAFFPTYMFALFNENQKAGPTTERNWGLLRPDGSPVYAMDLSGQNP